MDNLSPSDRKKTMSRVKGRDTGPERIVRSLLHNMGLRFRLHDRKLPGVPDVVLKRFRTAIFVHGCFWHRHHGCKGASFPAVNTEFWRRKFDRTVERDAANHTRLIELGFTPLIVWECELKDLSALKTRLAAHFFGSTPQHAQSNQVEHRPVVAEPTD